MINDKDIVFVTTTLHTKWLNYQKRLIKNMFPDSQHIIVDGRGNWPNSWFYWIDEVKKCNQKYYVHIDEDFFLTSREEFMKVFDKMESENLDLVGCSDAYHHFRGANPVAINTFLMYGKVEHVKMIETDLKSLKYEMKSYDGLYHWVNSADLKMEESYKDDFVYDHKLQGNGNFNCEQEPYYAFLWSMKKIGCKFGYLYPHFDDRFKSTNPRLSEKSADIGIHMWYTRQWNQSFDVHDSFCLLRNFPLPLPDSSKVLRRQSGPHAVPGSLAAGGGDPVRAGHRQERQPRHRAALSGGGYAAADIARRMTMSVRT